MASMLTKLKPKRRWAQISLRTMLVLVTVHCLWVVPAERQRRTVAAVRELGGNVSYKPDQVRSEAFTARCLRRWLPPDYFDEIEYVDLMSTQVTDAELAHLRSLAGLQSLNLINCQGTDAGLAHLQRLTSLMSREQIATDWAARGFSCDLWTDPPGQRWEDFVHDTDELVIVLKGEMEVEGDVHHPRHGEELLIPAGAFRSVEKVILANERPLHRPIKMALVGSASWQFLRSYESRPH